jgi:hypothetical protein
MSANLAVPNIKKIQEALTYADRFYKDDQDKIGKIIGYSPSPATIQIAK